MTICKRVNYIIKCNRKNEKFIQICGKIELQNKNFSKVDLYELPPFYHRRALLITRILCKRKKLQRNCKAVRTERKFGIKRAEKKLHFLSRYSQILSIYGSKEKLFAK